MRRFIAWLRDEWADPLERMAIKGIAAIALVSVAFGLLMSSCTSAHAQVPSAAQQHKRTLVRIAHSEWGLGAPVAVFAAQVHQESAWRTDALSHVGAQGLAQFMPATARWWCGATGTAAADCQPTNPTWAMRSLVGYDKWLYDRAPAHYTPRDRMWVALRGYNGGLGHWQREAASAGLAQPSRTRLTRPAAKPAALPCIAKKTWATPTAFWWCCSRAMRHGGRGYEQRCHRDHCGPVACRCHGHRRLWLWPGPGQGPGEGPPGRPGR